MKLLSRLIDSITGRGSERAPLRSRRERREEARRRHRAATTNRSGRPTIAISDLTASIGSPTWHPVHPAISGRSGRRGTTDRCSASVRVARLAIVLVGVLAGVRIGRMRRTVGDPEGDGTGDPRSVTPSSAPSSGPRPARPTPTGVGSGTACRAAFPSAGRDSGRGGRGGPASAVFVVEGVDAQDDRYVPADGAPEGRLHDGRVDSIRSRTAASCSR